MPRWRLKCAASSMSLAPSITVPADVCTSADNSANGLTSNEALHRLEKTGPNSMPDTAVNPLRRALAKFWSPIPWMLEAAILLELVLGKYVEAGIIAVLLMFNAALGFFQEGRAQATLAALKSRLALTASVCRDGVWKNCPAADLVAGDIVKLSLGDVVAADVQLIGGNCPARSIHAYRRVHRDGSGRRLSRPMPARSYGVAKRSRSYRDGNPHQVWSHGRIGPHGPCRQLTAKGRLARRAQSRGVQWHSDCSAGGVCAGSRMPVSGIIPLVLTAILASIPVALPAMFTLASALGARALAVRAFCRPASRRWTKPPYRCVVRR